MINLARINELARKQKTEGLTEAEKTEQAKLRREYIDSIKADLSAQLDKTIIIDPVTGEQKFVSDMKKSKK